MGIWSGELCACCGNVAQEDEVYAKYTFFGYVARYALYFIAMMVVTIVVYVFTAIFHPGYAFIIIALVVGSGFPVLLPAHYIARKWYRLEKRAMSKGYALKLSLACSAVASVIGAGVVFWMGAHQEIQNNGWDSVEIEFRGTFIIFWAFIMPVTWWTIISQVRREVKKAASEVEQ